MRMRVMFAALAMLAATTGTGSAAADEQLSAAEIQKMVVGKTITSTGAKLRYGADGRYTFNGKSPGTYAIAKGKICVKFDDGNSRCDWIVRNGGKTFMVNSGGRRFPFH